MKSDRARMFWQGQGVLFGLMVWHVQQLDRLALGLFTAAIAARLRLEEREVDATLRRLAKVYVEVNRETTNRIAPASGGHRIEHDRGGYGHGAAALESILRADHEAGV